MAGKSWPLLRLVFAESVQVLLHILDTLSLNYSSSFRLESETKVYFAKDNHKTESLQLKPLQQKDLESGAFYFAALLTLVFALIKLDFPAPESPVIPMLTSTFRHLSNFSLKNSRRLETPFSLMYPSISELVCCQSSSQLYNDAMLNSEKMIVSLTRNKLTWIISTASLCIALNYGMKEFGLAVNLRNNSGKAAGNGR